MEKLTVVKIGGNVLDDTQNLQEFLDLFSKLEGKKILVHGGGKIATQIALRLGIQSTMVEGRRVTDAQTIEVVTMVYAGLTNKSVVAQLQARGVNAMGLSGADANLIQTKKRNVAAIDYGFVGDLFKESVNVNTVKYLFNQGITPVFCAITHDGNGQLLNTNADSVASALAVSLSSSYKVDLIYCFEKNGVLTELDNPNSVIPKINQEIFEQLQKDHIISEGMLPKLSNALNSVDLGVENVIIKKFNNLLETHSGTLISK